VALKVDEAPLAINAAFAQTLALKRSAGLETVACWQTDAQWEPELREQLDALFAHRVLFATASAGDARNASALLMSEFSDQIRGGDEQLVRLSSPDVRLHLPRHTALASWTTQRGRERPFIATTMAPALDRERIEWHARAQEARGGRELTAPAPPPDPVAPPASRPAAAPAPGLPQSPAAPAPGPRQRPAAPVQSPPQPCPASYAELLALDCASRMRLLRVPRLASFAPLDRADREALAWIAGANCALTSQVHRRLRPERSLTVTQRQLKRLADAGLIARFQLHRDDGGGIPLCCAATAAAIELLGVTGRRAVEPCEETLGALRIDLHLVGWLLALEARAGAALVEVLGPGRAAIAPGVPGPGQLELGAGMRPRGFERSRADGQRTAVERFAGVRPNAVASLSAGETRRDLLVVADGGDEPGWLDAYDHLLGAWWRTVERYRRAGAPPQVVVVCADPAVAHARARSADVVLSAAVAQVGVDPRQWRRGGREGIHFVAEEDLHRGELRSLQVPVLPPALRERGGEPLRAVFAQLPPEPVRGSAKPPWR